MGYGIDSNAPASPIELRGETHGAFFISPFISECVVTVFSPALALASIGTLQ